MKESKANQMRLSVNATIDDAGGALVSDATVGDWLHLELMDIGANQKSEGRAKYWLAVGDETLWITIHPQGYVEVKQ